MIAILKNELNNIPLLLDSCRMALHVECSFCESCELYINVGVKYELWSNAAQRFPVALCSRIT